MHKPVFEKAYKEWFLEIKAKVHRAQLKAASNFNLVLIDLYWQLGKEIVDRQAEFKWGDNFLQRLSLDLKSSFPKINGFSRRNLYTIRQWYLFFSSTCEFVPQPVAQLPWSYQTLLISRVKDIDIVIIYAKATHKYGWSRDTLDINIKNEFHARLGSADHNFELTLPRPQSDLAKETIKDPYHFDFLGLEMDAQEREIE